MKIDADHYHQKLGSDERCQIDTWLAGLQVDPTRCLSIEFREDGSSILELYVEPRRVVNSRIDVSMRHVDDAWPEFVANSN